MILVTPITDCSVCGKEFQPRDDMEFVCDACQDKLDCPKCKSDDVNMDWGVDMEAEQPYYWIIECANCGECLKSRPHGIDETGATARETHSKWLEVTHE